MRLFIGPNGLRAGWRLLIYLAIFLSLAAALQIALGRVFHLHRPSGPIDPWFGLIANAILLVPMMIAAFIMSRIERRPMGLYGLPLRGIVARDAVRGALVGFVSLTVVIGIVLAFGDVHFNAVSIAPRLAIDGLAFLAAFVLVGLSEEFLFRGYAQYTLGQWVGFWPAAVLLSLTFAVAHIGNPGESVMGVIQVAVFGLVFCFALRQTGTLWFAVGYHTAWDWAETFFYGVPDSGYRGTTSLLHGTMVGPAWFSGGTDGPEGSFLTMIALLALVPLVGRMYSVRN